MLRTAVSWWRFGYSAWHIVAESPGAARSDQLGVIEVDPRVGADEAVVLAAELSDPGLPARDLTDPPCLRVIFARLPPRGLGAVCSLLSAGWCREVLVASLRIWRSRSRV
ncbi:hypothetical protein CKJ66_26315 [Mycobacterium avium]|uniref:Uncharacterized protein n=1 Tax=Mycobacterium avium TaxID=1764 RepID=A0A2A2ZBN7_MYCAV|nr:hypothetical protein CKJ66_26315 [Mycobacterium avium]